MMAQKSIIGERRGEFRRVTGVAGWSQIVTTRFLHPLLQTRLNKHIQVAIQHALRIADFHAGS